MRQEVAKTGAAFVLKGIMSAEDAALAAAAGVDGIIVSNHGGRQLDGTGGTLDQLSDIVKAVEAVNTARRFPGLGMTQLFGKGCYTAPPSAAKWQGYVGGRRQCEVFLDGGIRRVCSLHILLDCCFHKIGFLCIFAEPIISLLNICVRPGKRRVQSAGTWCTGSVYWKAYNMGFISGW